MNGNHEEVWSAIPAKALHPVRVPMIEAMWRIDQSLSAIDLVDVLDGSLSMWEAVHHLGVLETLDVIAQDFSSEKRSAALKRDPFHVRYRLKRPEVH